MKKKLTPKQQLFVDEYPKDWNATQAAIRAGYSKRSASMIGLENLGKPLIQEALASKTAILAKKCGISTERLIEEWDCIAYQNPEDLITVDGNGYANFSKWQDIPEHAKRAMSEIQTITAPDGKTTFKVKFYNKAVGLRNLGEMNGNYIERKEIGKPGEFEKYNDEQLEEIITRRTARIGVHDSGNGAEEGKPKPDRVRRVH